MTLLPAKTTTAKLQSPLVDIETTIGLLLPKQYCFLAGDPTMAWARAKHRIEKTNVVIAPLSTFLHRKNVVVMSFLDTDTAKGKDLRNVVCFTPLNNKLLLLGGKVCGEAFVKHILMVGYTPALLAIIETLSAVATNIILR